MTLEECYTAMGANYQDVLKRFYKSDMIRRFVKMFLQDDSFRLLTDAMAKQDVKEAFRAAHTIKGLCSNLGFTALWQASGQLCERLRAGERVCVADTDPVRSAYRTLTNALIQLRDSQ